jgi:hypothetical protein
MLKVKKVSEDFVLKNYPELFRAVSKIPELTLRQRELIYGMSIDIAEKSEGNISVFYTEFSDCLNLEEEI